MVLHRCRSWEFVCSNHAGLLCVAVGITGSTWKIQLVLQHQGLCRKCQNKSEQQSQALVSCQRTYSSGVGVNPGLSDSEYILGDVFCIEVTMLISLRAC